jgi:LPXTG-motif cell wall-anchored protein
VTTGTLPRTGGSFAGPLLIAVGAIVLGAVAVLTARARRSADRT